jgi:hypothetical protein
MSKPNFNISRDDFDFTNPDSYAEFSRLKEKFNVRIWYVAHTVQEGNCTIYNSHLSPYFSSRQKARLAHRELKKKYSDSYVANVIVYFNPLRESDFSKRTELLAIIH